MALELAHVFVDDVRFGEATSLAGHVLTLDADALIGALHQTDERIAQVQVHLCHPGDGTRLTCVKDVIEPRWKVSGEQPGVGRVHVLRNVAVTTCGQIVGYQEGLIDTSGPGARYTPFSALHQVVLEMAVDKALGPHAHEEVVRKAGLEAARHLARHTAGHDPDQVYCIDPQPIPADRSLPRIVYLYMLLSQGLLHDTYVRGRSAAEGLPQRMDLGNLLDDAIVSGNCVSACDKNTTYHHQNNPVVAELLQRHGTDLEFAGIVLTNEPTRLDAKERSATQAVEEVRALRADGVVISKEGFGNPDADLMMLIRGLEAAGVRCVGITDEFAGAEGASQSLADTAPEADALISTGNANQRVTLPPMARLIGPVSHTGRLAGAFPDSLHTDGSVDVELQAIIGSTNQLGYGRLSCREV